ncbi:MAG: YafY family protein [Ardenticatenaceae bacterium]|nr:YafY family protein [Ardenticatenaceae bacterium]
MNRIDRLFAILLKLQSQGRVQAAELAEAFAISRRTVYRDIAALNEMGVPIVSLPGEGYELMPGYYLPPLVFSEDEAAALVLGAHLLQEHTTGRLPSAVLAALEKLMIALPDRSVKRVNALRQVTTFGGPDVRFDLDDRLLNDINQAIQEKRLVEVVYHSCSKNEQTVRQIEAESLHYDLGQWYVNAFCRLRGGWRAFRFNRIEAWELLDKTFTPRPRLQEEPQPPIEIQLLFAPETARWVRERQHYAFVEEQPAEGGVEMHYAVKRFDEILPWVLSWGSQVKVVEPAGFRDAIKMEIRKLQVGYEM